MAKEKVVTRFAPSPTGFMHVGSLRTALFAWLWARKNNGEFILRIEDTDKEREVAGSIDHILESLNWVKIDWDREVEKQSDRLDIYKKYAQVLIDKGLAYPDPYTEAEVEKFRKEAEENKQPFLFRNHRPASTGQGGPNEFEIWDNKKPLRFKVPEIKRFEWDDVVFGKLSAGEEALDDFILIKSDGYPTYNFAHIVDDIEMGVTHVMRGQEFISSTPKFLSLYEALEIKPPIFVTLPPILGEGGTKKLSKRDGAKDILDYKKEGYLSEVMVNFLAFLGWNPGDEKEIMSFEELINSFDISKIQKSGARWNDEKLDWLNKEYLKKLSYEEQEEYITNFLSIDFKQSNELLHNLVPIIIERISKGSDILEMEKSGELDYFIKKPNLENKDLLIWKSFKNNPEKYKKTKELLGKVLEVLEKNENEDIYQLIWPLAEKYGKGEVLWPLRTAISGLEKSPDPFSIMKVIGKKETIQRLNLAIKKLDEN